MMKATFKAGDEIVLKDYHNGIEGGRILVVDGDYYLIRILRGTARIPISTIDNNYKLKN